MRHTMALLNEDERSRLLTNLRALNGQREFFAMLRPHVNEGYQRQIDGHLQARPCNPFYLAGAIRHAFAHGILTASPVNAPPQSVATVSRFMCRALMKLMDREFESRMAAFEDMLNHNDDDS